MSILNVLEWAFNGIYDGIIQFFSWVFISSVITMIKIKVFLISISWDIAKQVLVDLDISSAVNSAWASLESRTLNFFTILRIPEALNFIMSAHMTKFVLRFFGM